MGRDRDDLVKHFLTHGQDIKPHNLFGYELLHLAVLDSFQDDLLLKYVPLDDCDGPDKFTPLMLAAKWGPELTPWLLRNAADPYRKDAHGRDSISWSTESNTLNSGEWLRELVTQDYRPRAKEARSEGTSR